MSGYSMESALLPDPNFIGRDFAAYWFAGRFAFAGGNPYDIAALQEFHNGAILGSRWEPDPAQFVFPGLPICFWFYALLSFLPLNIAYFAFQGLTILLCFMVGIGVLRRFQFDSTKLLGTPLVLFAVICFPPLQRCLVWGQLSAVLLTVFWTALTLLSQNSFALAGGVMSIVLLKPQIFLFFLLLLIAFLPSHARHRFLLGFILGGGLQGGLSYLIAPHLYTAWMDGVISNGEVHAAITTASFLQSLVRVFQFPASSSLYIWSVLLLGGIGLGIGLRVFSTFSRWIGKPALFMLSFYFLPLSCLFAPYIWSFDFLILLPNYLVLVGILTKRL
ncbi:MAG: DUF2029 domain-containing protein, partial [Bdellovibrionales bacterium]|nr:DUF2029 domain-containing protein [Bdellovibrionales bacterium]